MTDNFTFLILANSFVGIFASGIYIAAAWRIWRRRSKWWSVLSIATALLYVIPTSLYVWRAFHGTAETTGNVFGLLFILLPALLILYGLKATWQDEADANAIIAGRK